MSSLAGADVGRGEQRAFVTIEGPCVTPEPHIVVLLFRPLELETDSVLYKLHTSSPGDDLAQVHPCNKHTILVETVILGLCVSGNKGRKNSAVSTPRGVLALWSVSLRSWVSHQRHCLAL